MVITMAKRRAKKNDWGDEEWFVLLKHTDCSFNRNGKCYYFKEGECDEVGFDCERLRCSVRKTMAKPVAVGRKKK